MRQSRAELEAEIARLRQGHTLERQELSKVTAERDYLYLEVTKARLSAESAAREAGQLRQSLQNVGRERKLPEGYEQSWRAASYPEEELQRCQVRWSLSRPQVLAVLDLYDFWVEQYEAINRKVYIRVTPEEAARQLREQEQSHRAQLASWQGRARRAEAQLTPEQREAMKVDIDPETNSTSYVSKQQRYARGARNARMARAILNKALDSLQRSNPQHDPSLEPPFREQRVVPRRDP